MLWKITRIVKSLVSITSSGFYEFASVRKKHQLQESQKNVNTNRKLGHSRVSKSDSLLVIRQKGKSQNGGNNKTQQAKFSVKNKYILPLDTHTCVCVSVGKKYSFFGKFGMICFAATPVLRFVSIYDGRSEVYSGPCQITSILAKIFQTNCSFSLGNSILREKLNFYFSRFFLLVLTKC